MKEELQSVANRTILIKAEKRRLRQDEITHFKHEVDVDRRFATDKIIKHH